MASSDYEGDEILIAKASAGKARIGFSVAGDGNRTRHLLDVPKNCKLMGPTLETTACDLYFQSLQECNQAFKRVKDNQYSMKTAASWFPFVEASSNISYSKKRTVENEIKIEVDETCLVKVTCIPMKSFRISRDQMCLTKEVEEEAICIDSPIKAKQFLEKFNSHIFDGIYHLGGVFCQGIRMKSTKGVTRDLLTTAAKLKLESEIKSEITNSTIDLTRSCEVKIDNCYVSEDKYSESFSYIIGPNAKDVATFQTLMETERSSWHIIHYSQENVFVPLWDVMIKSGNSLLFEPANMIMEQWQSSVASIAQDDTIVCKMLQDSLVYRIGLQLKDFNAQPPSEVVQMLFKICNNKGDDLKVFLFDVPDFVGLVEYIAQSSDVEMSSGKGFLREMLRGKLLENCTRNLPPCVHELLQRPNIRSRLTVQKQQSISPADLPQYLEGLLKTGELHSNVEKAIQDCIHQPNSKEVKEVVKNYGFGEQGYWEGAEALTKAQVESMIKELKKELFQEQAQVPRKNYGFNEQGNWEGHEALTNTQVKMLKEGTKYSHTGTEYMYNYMGDLIVDRKLQNEEESQKDRDRRMIDCLRHGIQPFSSTTDDDHGIWFSEDEVEDDKVEQLQQSSGIAPIDILIRIMENSSFLAQIALCKLLLEQRFAIPLIFPSKNTDPQLCQIVNALEFFQVHLGKQEMLSLAADTKLFRVVFISTKNKDVSENATMAAEITKCNFVSQYGKNTSIDLPIVEIGVGFIPGRYDRKRYSPCISIHILGDYSKLHDVISPFATLIIEETKHGKGIISNSYLWESSDMKLSRKGRKLSGPFKQVKDKLLELLSIKLDEFNHENSLDLKNAFGGSRFATAHDYSIPERFPNLVARDSLELQKSYQKQAEDYFSSLGQTNQMAEQRRMEINNERLLNLRNEAASRINGLPIIQFFTRLLSLPDVTERVLSIQQLGVTIVENNAEVIQSAEEKKNALFEQFQQRPSNFNMNEYRIAQQEYAERIVNLEHLWRELSHVFVSDPQKHGYLPKLAAQHLLDGFPLEILDGDAAMFCNGWVSRILHELDSILKSPKVFVLSVMGLQSSGKSTLLNLMFGTQLRTSAGQCTRGIYLQLVKSDRKEYDYVLLLDTEGIRAPEFKNSEAHDNRLATFAILPADACILLVSNEDDMGLKEVLPMVMLAYKRSKISEGNGIIQSKISFFYRSVDTNDTGRLRSSRQKLLEYLQGAAQQVASNNPDVENLNISSYIDFRIIEDNEDSSDVKYLGNLKKSNIPPEDIPDSEYGEKVMKAREHIHKRVTEGSWKARSLIEWDRYLNSVWECICTSNFELSFKSTIEYWSYEKLRLKLSICRQRVAEKWTEQFEASEGMERSKRESKDIWFDILSQKVSATIYESSEKVKSFLEEPRWQKWKIYETNSWEYFLRRTEDQWARKIQDCVYGVVHFENKFNDYLQDVKIEIENMFSTKQIVIGNRDLESLDNIERDHFSPLFDRILRDAQQKYPPLAKEVASLVNGCYERSGISAQYDLNKKKKKLLRDNVGLGNKTSKKKDLLDSIIQDCLKAEKQYTDATVDRVIDATKNFIKSLKGIGLHKHKEASLHRHARARVTEELKRKQEAWDNDHNVAGRLNIEKDRLRVFFRNRVQHLGGTEILLSEMKEIFASNWLKCFTGELLLRTFCSSMQSKPWVYDWKCWRAKLDLHLLNLMEEGKIDEMLNYMIDGRRHSNHVLNTELKKNWFSDAHQRKLWDDFRQNFETSWTLAIASVGENKSIMGFLNALRTEIRQRTQCSQLAKLLDTVNAKVYEKYEKVIDYKDVSFKLCKHMETCFAVQGMDGELLDKVKERMRSCENESSRPRCDVNCPRCGVACFHQAGHECDHDTAHQPSGIAGVYRLKLSTRPSRLCHNSCSKSVTGRDNMWFPDTASVRSYTEFPSVYPGWAMPREHSGFSSQIREYVFFHYQEHLIKRYPDRRICKKIPPEYNHDIELIQRQLEKFGADLR